MICCRWWFTSCFNSPPSQNHTSLVDGFCSDSSLHTNILPTRNLTPHTHTRSFIPHSLSGGGATREEQHHQRQQQQGQKKKKKKKQVLGFIITTTTSTIST